MSRPMKKPPHPPQKSKLIGVLLQFGKEKLLFLFCFIPHWGTCSQASEVPLSQYYQILPTSITRNVWNSVWRIYFLSTWKKKDCLKRIINLHSFSLLQVSTLKPWFKCKAWRTTRWNMDGGTLWHKKEHYAINKMFTQLNPPEIRSDSHFSLDYQ